MKIAFLLTNYYPHMDAVGNCVNRVIQNLSQSNEIDILCLNGTTSNKPVIYEGCKIIYCGSKFNQITTSNKKCGKIIQLILRLLRFVTIVFSKNLLRRDVYNSIFEVLKINRYDAVVPCMYPVEGVLAALDSGCNKVIPYMFDNFVDCNDYYRFNIFKKIFYNSNMKLMSSILSRSSGVIATPTFKPFMESYFKNIKINYCEHPLLANRTIENLSTHDGQVKCLYAGSLVRNYIVPENCLSFIDLISNKIDICVHFYIGGNALEGVKQASISQPQLVTWADFIPRDQLIGEYKNYDIFISIAERSGKQFSSKIFDYISTGKPIIHFYEAENDINLNVLRKYPNALLIKSDEFKKSNLLSEYLKFFSKKNDRVDYDTIKKLYADADPLYTCQILETMLKK